MRKKGIYKIALKMSEGVLSSLTDLLLWNVFFCYELNPFRYSTNIGRAEFLAKKRLGNFNYLSIKRAIRRARERGWIKEDLVLTKEGRERLEILFPVYFGKRKWDGNWFLVSYDIPEKKNTLRNFFRQNLKNLGFAEVHASLWISPFNFLAEVEKIVKEYNLSPFVILAVSNKVGREESKILANKLWKLEKINKDYLILIEKTKKINPENLIFQYLTILNKDPQLPTDLLPEDWAGDDAYQIFKKHLPLS